MGLFDKAADVLGKVAKAAVDPFGISSDVFHAVSGTPTESAKRDQAKLVADQARAYKDQTEILRQETDRARNEQVAEKRRIQEKQIRSLRRNRGGGMLGSGEPATGDMSSTLGS